MLEERGGHAVIAADVDLVDVPGMRSFSCTRRAISPIAGWLSEPEGYGLMETPGEASVQGLPSFSHDGVGIEAAAGGLEKCKRALENIRRGGPAERREIGGDGAVLGPVAGLERLGHRAEVVAEPEPSAAAMPSA